MRKAVRIAGWIAAVTVLLAGGLLLYLSSGPGEGFLKGLVADEVGAVLDAKVSIERLETNVFSRVEMEGIVIDPAASVDTPASGRSPIERIDIARLRVDYGLFTILFGTIEVDSLVITGARIAIRPDSLSPLKPQTESPAIPFIDETGRFIPPVRIRYAELSDVAFQYDDRSLPIALTASDIGLIAGFGEEDRGDFRLAVDSAQVEYLDSPVSVTDILLSGSINRGEPGTRATPVTVDTFRANAADVHLAGRFEAGTESITGDLAISGDPNRLLTAISDGLDNVIGDGLFSARVEFAVVKPLDSADVTWSLTVPSYAVAGIPFSNLRCAGGWRSDTLTIDGISFGLYDGVVSGSGWLETDSLMAHRFNLNVKQVRASDYWKSRTKASEFTRIPVTIDARLDSRGDLSSPIDLSAKSTLAIASRKSLIAAMEVTYAARRLSIQPDRSVRTNSSIRTDASVPSTGPGGGMVGLSADLELRKTGYEGTVELDVPSIAVFSAIVDTRGIAGGFVTRGMVRGKGSNVNFSSTTTSDEVSFKGQRVIDKLYATVTKEGDDLTIDTCIVSGTSVDMGKLANAVGLVDTFGVRDSTRLSSTAGPTDSTGLAGTAGPTDSTGLAGVAGPNDSSGSIASVRVSDPPTSDHIGGMLSYTVSIRGSTGNPTAELQANIDKPSFGSLAFREADILVSLSDSVITLSEALLRKESSVTAIEGTADLRSRSGELTAIFSRTGSPTPDTIDAAIAYHDSTNFSLSAVSHRLAIATVREYLPSIPVEGGMLAFQADLRRTPGDLGAVVPFAITGLTAGKGILDSIGGTIRFTDGTIAVDSLTMVDEGRRHFLSATVALEQTPDGSYAIGWNSRTTGRISGDTLDLATVASFVPYPLGLGGWIDLDLGWDGIIRRPGFRGTLDFQDVRYGPDPKSPLFTDLHGTISMGEGAVKADSIRATLGKVPLVATVGFDRGDSANFSGTFNISSDTSLLLGARVAFTGDSIDVVIESNDLNLAVAQPFVASLRKLRGQLTTKFTIKGPIADPAVDGMLSITGASFEPGTSGQPVTDGAVSARLSGGKLVLDSATAAFGGGTVFASGSALVDSGGLKDVDLGLRATGIKVTRKNLYQMNVKTVDLRLRSARERYDLTGVLEFGESKFIRDIEISDMMRMMGADEIDPLEEPKKPEPLDLMASVTQDEDLQESIPDFLKKVDFDIELKNADGLWVDNNLARFSTNHDLRLEGTVEKASLTGRISVRDRGELIFLDRRFEILTGIIDCSDPNRLNPVVNLTAQTEITEQSGGSQRPTRYTVTLTVTGPLDEFEYELTSKPSLERADIISLIALGMTQYQLESGGDKDAVYKDRSEVVASQQISNSVNRFFDNWLGDFLALDHIGIGGNLFDPNETRFEVTKRWSDRVEIRYSTSITDVDEQILSAEYRINDFFYLEGKTDQQEDSGADLKFRIWFK